MCFVLLLLVGQAARNKHDDDDNDDDIVVADFASWHARGIPTITAQQRRAAQYPQECNFLMSNFARQWTHPLLEAASHVIPSFVPFTKRCSRDCAVD